MDAAARLKGDRNRMEKRGSGRGQQSRLARAEKAGRPRALAAHLSRGRQDAV
jgi:hypothetical protein